MEKQRKQREIPPLRILENRGLVTAWAHRREMVQHLLCQREYGFFFFFPQAVWGEILHQESDYCGGKAIFRKVHLHIQLSEACTFSFPVYQVLPKGVSQPPVVVFLNFRDAVPDRYLPSEEICDHGVAVTSFCYTDVTSDDGDFSNGLAGALKIDRRPGQPGKLALWAWAASRVADWLIKQGETDSKRMAVAGHSRLGKTALLAGAMDTRFGLVWSNDSGCSGAALHRGKEGERISDIWGRFPFWFCTDFARYAGHESQLPFDQHDLLSLIAPRRLYVSSASEDSWADPVSEFLACAAAQKAWGVQGLSGLGCTEPLTVPGYCHGGQVGYHLRAGTHYVTREDWQLFLKFSGWSCRK